MIPLPKRPHFTGLAVFVGAVAGALTGGMTGFLVGDLLGVWVGALTGAETGFLVGDLVGLFAGAGTVFGGLGGGTPPPLPPSPSVHVSQSFRLRLECVVPRNGAPRRFESDATASAEPFAMVSIATVTKREIMRYIFSNCFVEFRL
jgi:hypothetical protein